MLARTWVVCLLSCGVLLGSALGGAEQKQPMIDQPAPPFHLQSLDGKKVALADYKGKFVVLHFGTGW